jgi:hypothetical protein
LRRGVFIAVIEAGARPVLHRLATRDPRRSQPPPNGLQGPPPPQNAAPVEAFIAARHSRWYYVKDPRTGKRVARPNPPEKWETQSVPHLRVIDDALWEGAKVLKRRHYVISLFEFITLFLTQNLDTKKPAKPLI